MVSKVTAPVSSRVLVSQHLCPSKAVLQNLCPLGAHCHISCALQGHGVTVPMLLGVIVPQHLGVQQLHSHSICAQQDQKSRAALNQLIPMKCLLDSRLSPITVNRRTGPITRVFHSGKPYRNPRQLSYLPARSTGPALCGSQAKCGPQGLDACQ